MDYLSDIIAVLAIICAIKCSSTTDRVTKNVGNKALKKDYFDLVFKEFMINTFPITIMDKICWKDGNICEDIYDVEDIIMNFIKQINPYRYLDYNFYQDVYVDLYNLEDYIMELIQIKESDVPSTETYNEIRRKIDLLGEKLYTTLINQFEC